jgi:predicted O-methyltransferase YrrM
MESWISDLGLQKSVADSRIAIAPRYSLSFARDNHKPYFGRQLSAFQSPPVRYALLADLTRYVLREKPVAKVLEVGAWAGASAITFGLVVQEIGITDCKILCVDPWEKCFVPEDSSLHYKRMNAAITDGRIQELFHHNVNVCGLRDMVEVKKACSRDVLPHLESATFDLVYIDGSHKKDDVLYDLQQAKRLVRSGGVICGDDLELLKAQIDSGAHQRELMKDTDFVVDPRTGCSYHPGVTEAIAAVFEDVWREYGFWCVERSGAQWSIPNFQASNLEIPPHLKHAVEIPYGVFNGYEIFQLGEEFVAYPMSSPYWFQNRIVGSSIEEVVVVLDAIERIDEVGAPRIVESRSGFNILSYKGKSWVVNQSVGNVDFRDQEQLRSLAASGRILEAENMDEAKATVDRMCANEVRAPRLVESRNGFNIVSYKKKSWIIDQSVGSVDFLDEEQLKRLSAAGQLLETETIDEARGAADRMRIEQARAPQIVESRDRFNIVSYKGKSWVIEQSVGSVDFRDHEQLRRLVADESVIEVETLSEARAIVNKKLLKHPMAGVE